MLVCIRSLFMMVLTPFLFSLSRGDWSFPASSTDEITNPSIMYP